MLSLSPHLLCDIIVQTVVLQSQLEVTAEASFFHSLLGDILYFLVSEWESSSLDFLDIPLSLLARLVGTV